MKTITTVLLAILLGNTATSLSWAQDSDTNKAEALSIATDDARSAAISEWLDEHTAGLVAAYKHFHTHPELSFQELKTAAMIARQLEKAGFEVTTGVGRTGVVAVLENGDGPTLLIRGDMDALPIIEKTGVDYASQVRVKQPDGSEVGAMHACGHDVHCAMLFGVGPLLADLKEHWQGTVVVIAQPAEEIGRGSKAMIDDGLFTRFPKPDICLSLHVLAHLPTGTIGLTPGWAFANVDSVDITIFGKGGHGARPHSAIDPIVTAAHVITQLQTIVSRRLEPVEAGVISVGSIHGGTKHNIIPDEVKLELTVRSYTDEVRELLLESIRQVTTDVCRSFQCPKDPEVLIDKNDYTPAAYNDPELTAAAGKLFRELLGDDKVVELTPTMGGEDFSRFSRQLKVPGLQYRVGVIDEKRWNASQQPGADSLPSQHSALFYPDPEPSVRLSVESMAQLAMAILQGEE